MGVEKGMHVLIVFASAKAQAGWTLGCVCACVYVHVCERERESFHLLGLLFD